MKFDMIEKQTAAHIIIIYIAFIEYKKKLNFSFKVQFIFCIKFTC